MTAAVTELDLDQLLKLRLVVACFGKADLSKWWNTMGQLGRLGAASSTRRRPFADDAEQGTRAAPAAAEALATELRESAAELDRVIPLWAPSVDDGVIANTAPFFRLLPHWDSRTKAEAVWKELRDGDLDWLLLTMRFWPQRVTSKCTKDCSLAIAQGLEEVFWVEGTDGKWADRKALTKSVDELVKERTSPAVKSVLKSLLDAPAALGAAKKTRRGSGNA